MPIYPGFCLMQWNSNREEIGYSCFALNIKGGRVFSGIPMHKPIIYSLSSIGVNRWTNRVSDGAGLLLQPSWARREGGSGVQAAAVKSIESTLLQIEWGEWPVCALEIESHCETVSEALKSCFIISSLIKNGVGCTDGMVSASLCFCCSLLFPLTR